MANAKKRVAAGAHLPTLWLLRLRNAQTMKPTVAWARGERGSGVCEGDWEEKKNGKNSDFQSQLLETEHYTENIHDSRAGNPFRRYAIFTLLKLYR